MKWYWKVRFYFPNGMYHHAEVVTSSEWVLGSTQIDTTLDFYQALTGCKAIVEGMTTTPNIGVAPINAIFPALVKNSEPKHEPQSQATPSRSIPEPAG